MARIKFAQVMRQVLKYAPTQLANAAFTKIKKFYGLRKDEDGRIYAYATMYSTKVFDKRTGRYIRKPDKKTHDTFMMINPKKGNIALSCSCEDFKFRHEVALFKRGGADIEYSNGMIPHVTNPRLRFTCCKHCLRFYDYLSKRYPDIFVVNSDLSNSI